MLGKTLGQILRESDVVVVSRCNTSQDINIKEVQHTIPSASGQS